MYDEAIRLLKEAHNAMAYMAFQIEDDIGAIAPIYPDDVKPTVDSIEKFLRTHYEKEAMK